MSDHCRSVRLDQVRGPSKTPQTTFRETIIPGTGDAPHSCAKACQPQPHEREDAFMNLKLIVAEISEAATLMTALIPPPHAT